MESRRKRYLGLLAVLGIGVCLIAWIVGRGSREHQRLEARISEKIAAIKSAGSPVTAEDLVRLNPNPLPEQDATLLLGRIFAMTASAPQGFNVPLLGGKLPEGTADMDDETRLAIQQFLESNRSALAALPLAIEDTWFPGFFANGFTNTTKLPLVEIRRLVQILCVNAMAQAETNEALGCVQSVRQSFQVARTLRSDSMVGHMIRRAAESMTCMALERCLNRAKLSDQHSSP